MNIDFPFHVDSRGRTATTDDRDHIRDMVEQIRTRISDGRLPSTPCLVTWSASGRGELCAACDRRILGSETNVQCDFEDLRGVTMHFECYRVWHGLVTEGA